MRPRPDAVADGVVGSGSLPDGQAWRVVVLGPAPDVGMWTVLVGGPDHRGVLPPGWTGSPAPAGATSGRAVDETNWDRTVAGELTLSIPGSVAGGFLVEAHPVARRRGADGGIAAADGCRSARPCRARARLTAFGSRARAVGGP